MIKITLLLSLFIFSTSYSQTKYFIYFKDKGIKPTEQLNKASEIYKHAENLLSKKSIERRKKIMGENYLTYEDLPVNPEYINKIEQLNIKILRELSWFNSVSVIMNEEDKKIVEQLPFVDKVELVKKTIYKREDYPEINRLEKKSDTNLQLNYGESFEHLQLSDIPAVHSKGISGEGVLIGLLDSGFDWQTHEALQTRNVIDEYDFVFNDSITANEQGDAPTQDGHGTSVFSVAGGFKDGSLIGVSFNSDFILAKTENIIGETHVEEDNYAAAMIWMEGLGVDITSSSLGYSEFDEPEFSYTYEDMDGKTTIVTKACEEAFNRGVLTITSAGNEGIQSWHFITAPADGFNTISVGAVTPNNIVTSFSSRGPSSDGRIKPDVVTQGTSVYGATSSGSYRSDFSGTSAAAPIACGVAGLLLSAHPHLTNEQIRKILLITSDNSSEPDNERGYGLLSAKEAIGFPNLEVTDGSYILHKIFFSESTINPSSARLHLNTGSGFTEETLNFDGNYRFNFILPSLAADQHVEFYFTYQDSLANTFREPLIENYELTYGKLEVLTSIENKHEPKDYVLSNNYPNPFNNTTKINFIASANDKAELIIVDIIGQKVTTLFDGIAKEGRNIVEWNGRSDSGAEVSSGVYYYILKLGGKEYAQKMILLK